MLMRRGSGLLSAPKYEDCRSADLGLMQRIVTGTAHVAIMQNPGAYMVRTGPLPGWEAVPNWRGFGRPV